MLRSQPPLPLICFPAAGLFTLSTLPQVVFQMVAAETPDAVAVSPVLRALGEGGGRHAAVLVRLLVRETPFDTRRS